MELNPFEQDNRSLQQWLDDYEAQKKEVKEKALDEITTIEDYERLSIDDKLVLDNYNANKAVMSEMYDLANEHIKKLAKSLDTDGDKFVMAHQVRDSIDANREVLTGTEFEERKLFYRVFFNGINNPEHYNEIYEPVVKIVCRQLSEWVNSLSKCKTLMAFSPLGAKGTQWAEDAEFRQAVWKEVAQKQTKNNRKQNIER